MAIGVAHVTADLGSAVDRWGENSRRAQSIPFHRRARPIETVDPKHSALAAIFLGLSRK